MVLWTDCILGIMNPQRKQEEVAEEGGRRWSTRNNK
jgi:hypothetical protein